MIATMSPAGYNYEETMSTLRYANRAKNIKNRPKINEDPKDALMRQYQLQVQQLKEALLLKQTGTLQYPIVRSPSGENFADFDDDEEEGEDVVGATKLVDVRLEQLEKFESKLLGGKDLKKHVEDQGTSPHTNKR